MDEEKTVAEETATPPPAEEIKTDSTGEADE